VAVASVCLVCDSSLFGVPRRNGSGNGSAPWGHCLLEANNRKTTTEAILDMVGLSEDQQAIDVRFTELRTCLFGPSCHERALLLLLLLGSKATKPRQDLIVTRKAMPPLLRFGRQRGLGAKHRP
jgi:hypothetical protein